MKIQQQDDWQFSVDVYQTPSGPEVRLRDARMTLVQGDDAKRNLASVASILSQAAEKLQHEADGTKPS